MFLPPVAGFDDDDDGVVAADQAAASLKAVVQGDVLLGEPVKWLMMLPDAAPPPPALVEGRMMWLGVG